MEVSRKLTVLTVLRGKQNGGQKKKQSWGLDSELVHIWSRKRKHFAISCIRSENSEMIVTKLLKINYDSKF